MAFNIKDSQVPLIEKLADLRSLPYVLHLTGSRYFAYNGTEDDWDFFVSDESPDLIKALTDLGFYNYEPQYRSGNVTPAVDPSVKAVYRWMEGNMQVDILVVQKEHMSWRMRTQQHLLEKIMIMSNFLREDADCGTFKKIVEELWDLAYKSYMLNASLK